MTPLIDFRKTFLIDLEATCWDGAPPHGETSDIIEIGWALMNNVTLDIEDHGTVLVRPQRSTVSKFCTDLTTITSDMVTGANVLPLSGAGAYFRRDLKAQRYPWGSWGMYDHTMLRDSCKALDVQWFLGKQHLNVKAMYAILNPSERGPGMKHAMEELGLKFEGTQHRGGDDAYNLARVLQELKYSFQED